MVKHLKREELRQKFKIHHSIQNEGEKALIEFLDDKSPKTAQRRIRRTDKLTRHVDWPGTFERSMTSPPLDYVERRADPFPDEELVSALLNLADSWRTLHGDPDGNNERTKKLWKVSREHSKIRRRSVAYNRRLARRLWNIDREAADKIDRAVRFFDDRFGSDNDRAALQKLADEIAKQPDVLLEIVVLLSIARTAVENNGWIVSNISINDEKRMPAIEMRNEQKQLCCRLSKDSPKTPGIEDGRSDRIVWLREQMKETSEKKGPRDSQPDITLEFRREGGGNKSVYVLGDAKKNEVSGDDYIGPSVNKAAAYLVSYGHFMGVKMTEEDERDDPFECEISPAFTLFFLKDIDRIAGNDVAPYEKQKETIQSLFSRGNEDALPSVMALDMSHLGDYFDELLARIREIRASEARVYQRIRDIFALASDYTEGEEETQLFFATMQNKILRDSSIVITRHANLQPTPSAAAPPPPLSAATGSYQAWAPSGSARRSARRCPC